MLINVFVFSEEIEEFDGRVIKGLQTRWLVMVKDRNGGIRSAICVEFVGIHWALN